MTGQVTQPALPALQEFLACPTPDAWTEAALAEQELLLLDHCNCELKAASTALSMVFKYGDSHPHLARIMSRLAREELLHHEQVLKILDARGIKLRRLSASRYATGLRRLIRAAPQHRLVDILLINAFIEARSCERFAVLGARLAGPLGGFYNRLQRSEARHYQHYLQLAREYGEPGDLQQRIGQIRDAERELIEAPDTRLRFHSGIPQPAAAAG